MIALSNVLHELCKTDVQVIAHVKGERSAMINVDCSTSLPISLQLGLG